MNTAVATRDVYRLGGPTHTQWLKDLHAVNKVMLDAGALVTDPDDGWVGVDTSKLPDGVSEHYSQLCQLGYYHGWLS